jgi:outer membrane protein TolC
MAVGAHSISCAEAASSYRDTSHQGIAVLRSKIAYIGLACAIMTVSSCRHVPSAPIDPATNAQRLEARSLDDPSVAQALASYGLSNPEDGTWSLDQLTVAAWALRPAVAVARSEVAAATANIAVQGKRPNPTLSLGPERVFSGAGGVNPWVLATAMAFPIETAGKRQIRRQRAVASELAAEWQLGQTLWTVRANVRNALLVRDFAARAVDLDGKEASLRSDYRNWIDTRIKFGAATTQDRLLANQSLADVQSRLGRDQADLAAASADLAAALGVGSNTIEGVMPVYPAIEQISAAHLPDLAAAKEAAVVNRADVRRALAEYDVAEQDLKAAVAKQYPNIGFGPGYLFDQGEHKITLNVDIPVPLFDNGSAAIDAAIAARKVAAAKFDEIQASALAAVDSSYARYKATLRALAAATNAEKEAQRNADAAQRLMNAGGGDKGSLLTAQIDLVTRQRNALDARRAVLDAITAMENGVERPIFPASSLQPVGAAADSTGKSKP